MSNNANNSGAGEWVSTVSDALQSRLEEMKFKRSGRHKFERRNTGKSDVILFQSRIVRSAMWTQVHVAPVVQVNFAEVKRIATAIRGPSQLPSVGGVLGRFSPKGSLIEWTLRSYEDVQVVADDLWTAIVRWGIPFWELASSVATTLEAVEEGRITDKPPYWEERVAMIYLVRGSDAAVQFLLNNAEIDTQSEQKALMIFTSMDSTSSADR